MSLEISVSTSGYIGDTVTINLYSTWQPVRYTIYVYLNGLYIGSLLTQSANSYATWTPPLEGIGAEIPNSNWIDVKFQAVTSFTEGTETGDVAEWAGQLMMPPYQPTVNSITTFKSLTDKDGNELNWSQILQNRTEVFPLIYTNQVKNLYGASVQSVLFTVNGRQYVGAKNEVEGTFSINLGKIATSGRVGITATVTDSRGKMGSSTIYIDVVAYNPPAVENVRLYRCDSAGVESDNGAYLYAYADVAYTKIGTNAAELFVGYKLLSASGYQEREIEPGEANIINAGLSGESNYDIVIFAEDLFERSDQQHDVITTEMITLHMKNGGKAVGIGMYVTNEEDESVHVAWDTRVYGKMTANTIQVGDQVLTESDVQRLLALLS